jgi:hypothetical protein
MAFVSEMTLWYGGTLGFWGRCASFTGSAFGESLIYETAFRSRHRKRPMSILGHEPAESGMHRICWLPMVCLGVVLGSFTVEAQQPGRSPGMKAVRKLTGLPAATVRHVLERYRSGRHKVAGVFRAGKKDGLWIWWYPNGQKLAEGHFVEGLQSGRWAYWHVNGQKKIQGDFIAGAQSGIWYTWDQDGVVELVEEFTPLKPEVGIVSVDNQSPIEEPTETEQSPSIDYPESSPVTDGEDAVPPAENEEPGGAAESELRVIIRKWRSR